jgi:hypothetical protein
MPRFRNPTFLSAVVDYRGVLYFNTAELSWYPLVIDPVWCIIFKNKAIKLKSYLL